MEVIGRGSITVVDGSASETDAWEIKGHKPLMISGVVLHSLPAGYRFDLRRRRPPRDADAPRDPGRRREAGLVRRRCRSSRRGHPTRAYVDADDACSSSSATSSRGPVLAPRPADRRGSHSGRPRPDESSTETAGGPRGASGTRTLRAKATSATRAGDLRDDQPPAATGPQGAGPAPSPPDPRDPHPPRPQLLGPRAGRPDGRRPRRPRGVPVEQDPGLHRRPRRPPAEPRGPRLLARPSRRLHHAAQGGHVGRPHRRAHRPRAPEPRRHRRPPRQDPLAPASTAATTSSSSTARRRSASRPARSRSRSSTTSSPRATRTTSSTSWRSSSGSSASPSARPSGRAPRRSSTRRRQPRHPVHPPRPALARPARPGRPPAAHPGDDDVADSRHRGRHRVGQEPDEPPPRLGRPARPEERRRRDRGPGRRRREPHRLSRASSSRSTATTAAASQLDLRATRTPSAGAFPRAAAESRSGDLVVESYVAGNDYRCLVIGGKVAAIAERVPGQRDRRRRAHRPRARRHREPGPAPRASATRRS